jgi:hypothetical protein
MNLKCGRATQDRMSATEVITLENFDTPLHGHRTLFLYDPCISPSVPGLFDIALHGEVYSRRILLTSVSTQHSSIFRAEWDAIFQPRDPKEWSLILTYCVQAPKSICLVVDEGLAVPEALFQKLPAGSTVIVLRSIKAPVDSSIQRYAAVCFPVISDTTGLNAANVIQAVNLLTGTQDSEKKRAWLRELRVANAALVWTRIGESSVNGLTYWHDPTDGMEGIKHGLPKHIIANHMRVLADRLTEA